MKSINDLKKEMNLPIVIADEQGLITSINKPFEDVFGWQKSEIIGKPLATIIPKSLHDAHHLGFSRFLTTGKPTLLNQPLKLKAIKKDGKEFNAGHIIIAEEQNGNWVFGATIRPLGTE